MNTPKLASEIINETVEFYSADPSRRGVISESNDWELKCRYRTPDGKECAVGRCLIDSAKFADVRGTVQELDTSAGLDNILKPEYRGHHLSFWKSLQNLHDRRGNWGPLGLTERGLDALSRLKTTYA